MIRFILFFILFLSSFLRSQERIQVIGRDSIFPKIDGFTTVYHSTFETKTLENSACLVVISSVHSSLSTEDIEAIYEYVFKGGSVYIAAENEPFTAEANQLTQRIFFKHFQGEFIDSLAEPVIQSSTNNGLLQKPSSYVAGKTVTTFPLDYRLKVELWVKDNPLILSAHIGEGKVILDGGYSRFLSPHFKIEDELLPLMLWLLLK